MAIMKKNKNYYFTSTKIGRDFTRNRFLYLMAVPALLYIILFKYVPMYGTIVAFKRYAPNLGILGSPWIGLENFYNFFGSYYAWRVIRNTLLINLYSILFAFPAPILLALMVNEIGNRLFKRTAQTMSYIPHFVSTVVVAGIIVDFTRSDGLINNIIAAFGGTASNLLARPELFRGIYVISEIWQDAGYESIIFLAAIAAINIELYDSSMMDGAGRFQQHLHVTIPGIMPTIIVLLVLRIGRMMNIGFEKVLLLYNSMTYETADIVSTFTYRKGLLDFDFSFSAAVGLFNSVINLILLITANRLSRKISQSSLW